MEAPRDVPLEGFERVPLRRFHVTWPRGLVALLALLALRSVGSVGADPRLVGRVRRAAEVEED